MLKSHTGLALPILLLALTCGSAFGPEVRSEPIGAAFRVDTHATIALRTSDGEHITVERVSTTTSDLGSTWHGTVQETGESALMMWWKDGHLTGIVGHKGRIYRIMSIDGETRATPEFPAPTLPSSTFARLDMTGDPAQRVAALSKVHKGSLLPPTAASLNIEPFSDAERLALESKEFTIDLMVLYTKKAASRYIIHLPDLVALAVEQVNESFRNSGLGNIRLRLVHTQLVDYSESSPGHFDHLYRLVDGFGPFSSVRKLRDSKRADIVGMIVEDPSACGLSTRIAPEPEEAFFVVHHSCAAIMLSIAHEVGHILGARHDRQTDSINSPFPYGHGYVNGTKWRDIMSYRESCGGCPRLPYWSNPRIRYNGEPTGTADSDNARVILQQAGRVSRFR